MFGLELRSWGWQKRRDPMISLGVWMGMPSCQPHRSYVLECVGYIRPKLSDYPPPSRKINISQDHFKKESISKCIKIWGANELLVFGGKSFSCWGGGLALHAGMCIETKTYQNIGLPWFVGIHEVCWGHLFEAWIFLIETDYRGRTLRKIQLLKCWIVMITKRGEDRIWVWPPLPRIPVANKGFFRDSLLKMGHTPGKGHWHPGKGPYPR